MKKIILMLLVFSIGKLFSQVSFTHETISPVGGYTICAVDMNGDYLDDIVSVGNTVIQIFYQNSDGTFTIESYNVSPITYLPSWSIAAGDLTGNGYRDLLFGSSSGAGFMMNSGSGFTEQSSSEFIFSQRTNFVDINSDGHLDAFVCHDVAPNVYYLNDGEGNMEYHQGGLGDYPLGGHYGSLWVDYNNDGLIDMFIAKCSGGGQGSGAKYNELHRNNGDGTYTEVGDAAGLRDPLQTWSSAWGDFDNDGYMDVMVGANSLSDGGHKLMRNNGNGTFSNVTAGSGFDTFNGTSREHVTYDFNNDGYLDIAGNSNKIFLNNGDMTFTPVNVPFSGAAFADLNSDGFIDALINENIYYNNGNDNNWVVVHTQGVESNRDGIGARVELYSALGTQIRDVRSAEGFRFMSTINVHFGLGQDTEIDKIIIRWPSGIVDQVDNPAINESHLIIEGSTSTSTPDNDLEALTIFPNPASNELFINFREGLDGAKTAIYDLAGREVLNTVLNTNNTINVSMLSAGVYILKIDFEGNQIQRKFVKK